LLNRKWLRQPSAGIISALTTNLGFPASNGVENKKPEGTPGRWDSYSFAETFGVSNRVGVAVLYS
jgi:hypothetical protein